MFANAPIVPTVVEVQVLRISFDAPCHYCRGGRRATTNIRSVDATGWPPQANMDVCGPHADQSSAHSQGSRGFEIVSSATLLRSRCLGWCLTP